MYVKCPDCRDLAASYGSIPRCGTCGGTGQADIKDAIRYWEKEQSNLIFKLSAANAALAVLRKLTPTETAIKDIENSLLERLEELGKKPEPVNINKPFLSGDEVISYLGSLPVTLRRFRDGDKVFYKSTDVVELKKSRE